MNYRNQPEVGTLPIRIIWIAILLIAADMYWYGLTVEAFERLSWQLLGRPSGPVSFRFVPQPSVAAIKDGITDERTGRSPNFSTIMRRPQERMGRLRGGLAATAEILLIGITIGMIYKLLVFDRFHPSEALIVTLLLAFVPYLLIRGPAARIARCWRGCPPGEIR